MPRKILQTVGILFSLIAILIIIIIIMVKFFSLPIGAADIIVNDINLKQVEDGLYRGEYYSGLVRVRLTVEVRKHKITTIVIDEHKNGMGRKGENVIPNIISKQTLAVDAISGATVSSNTIKKAIEVALTEQ